VTTNAGVRVARTTLTPGPATQGRYERELSICGASLVADLSGAIYWPEERALVVADLHLEKGSSFATRGMLLPPYDTRATLTRLGHAIARHAPRIVIALGDSFHDGGGPARVMPQDRATLAGLQRGRDWVWIAGNHDPDPARDIGGVFAKSLSLGPLTFRHEPTPLVDACSYRQTGDHFAGTCAGPADGEIAGHLHPSARVAQRGRAVTRKCFATDGRRLIMPAFGAYAGGLNIRDHAFMKVFGARAFTAHLIGDRRLYAFAAARCLAG
jgi:DNA ligase-associated metallophosphoesterase